MLFELASGKAAYIKPSIHSIQTGRVEEIPKTVDSELRQLISKLLSRNVTDRVNAMNDFLKKHD